MEIKVSKPFPATITLLDYCDRKTSKAVRRLTLADSGKPKYADADTNKDRVKQGLPELPKMPFHVSEDLAETVVYGLTQKVVKHGVEDIEFSGDIKDFYAEMDDENFQKVAEQCTTIFSQTQEKEDKKKS